MKNPKTVQYVELVGEEAERFDRFFDRKESMIEVNPGKCILPNAFRMIGDDILNMPVYESDVWLCSFPRTGSTWAQEMAWLIGNDLDYEKAKLIQQIRCPLIELTSIMYDQHMDWHNEHIEETSVTLANKMPHPRYLRSHLPWGLLPNDMIREDNKIKPKVIYTIRNPKDMCVSFYHYCLLVHNLNGTFEEFCELFLDGRGPIGPVWTHMIGFWEKRNDPNLLILKFEDMKRDLVGSIRKTAAFLNKNLTDEQVEKLYHYLSFENMKNNKAVNLEPVIEETKGKEFLQNTNLRFIRKGEIGDWKNHMSDKIIEKFDNLMAEKFKGYDITFN